MHKTEIHGHSVTYEDDNRSGYEYLSQKIQYKEAEIIFDYAKDHGSAEFETHDSKNYSLVHNHDGTYTIVKR